MGRLEEGAYHGTGLVAKTNFPFPFLFSRRDTPLETVVPFFAPPLGLALSGLA